jgi:hypothetical protein
MANQRKKSVDGFEVKNRSQNNGREPAQRTGDQNKVRAASYHFSLTIVALHRL